MAWGHEVHAVFVDLGGARLGMRAEQKSEEAERKGKQQGGRTAFSSEMRAGASGSCPLARMSTTG